MAAETSNGTVAVKFYAELKQTFGVKRAELEVSQTPDVERLLAAVCDTPERRRALFAEPDVLRKEIVVLVNGRNIRFLDGVATGLAAGDEVAVFPPVFGG